MSVESTRLKKAAPVSPQPVRRGQRVSNRTRGHRQKYSSKGQAGRGHLLNSSCSAAGDGAFLLEMQAGKEHFSGGFPACGGCSTKTASQNCSRQQVPPALRCCARSARARRGNKQREACGGVTAALSGHTRTLLGV